MENGHANDCEQVSKTVGTMDDYTRKLMSMAKTTKDAHVDNKPCKWYLFGLCQFQTQCELVHDKGVPPNMIGCALPREKKHKLLKFEPAAAPLGAARAAVRLLNAGAASSARVEAVQERVEAVQERAESRSSRHTGSPPCWRPTASTACALGARAGPGWRPVSAPAT